MFYGQGLLKGLQITLRRFFMRPITEQYPEETHKLPPRTRGFFDWSEANCTACKACARACPNQVIIIDSQRDPETKKRIVKSFKMYLEYCLFCGLCVEACPFNAFHFNSEYELSCYKRGTTVYELVSSPEIVTPPKEDIRSGH